MIIESDAANQCVGKSDGQHSHCTAKVDLDVRKIKAQIPILATQDQVCLSLTVQLLKYEFRSPPDKYIQV